MGMTYAQGLYALAKEEGISQSLLLQLDMLLKIFEKEPTYLRLLANPKLSKQERLDVLEESLGNQVHLYVKNVLKLMTQKGYARYICALCRGYRELYCADNGILGVQAVTAVALNQDQILRLTKKLESLTGKTIELTNRVDPDCMGGVRLDYDGKRVDGTLQTRLETIRTLLNQVL